MSNTKSAGLYDLQLLPYAVRNFRRPGDGPEDWADLHGWAGLGLAEAVARYEPGRGVPFSSYAMHRVRGAVQDGRRKMRWRRTDLRPPAELHALVERAEADSVRADLWEPERSTEARRLLAQLPARDRRLVEAVYLRGRTLVEVAQAEGISRTRVWQILERALARLRRRAAEAT